MLNTDRTNREEKRTIWLAALILFMLLLFILVITNPSKGDYINWLKEEAISRSDNSLEKGMIEVLGAAVIDASTETSNFVVFSIFETNLGNNTIIAIGVANNFIPIKVQIDTFGPTI
jgi:hypothetical protein